MGAKEYLRQIQLLDIKINQRLQELNQLRESAISLSSPKNGEIVQTSKENHSMHAVDKYVDLEKEINKMIDDMTDLRHEIIEKIQGLSNGKYINVLHKRYVECKSFELIAVEMNYACRHVHRLHGYALEEFRRCHGMS